MNNRYSSVLQVLVLGRRKNHPLTCRAPSGLDAPVRPLSNAAARVTGGPDYKLRRATPNSLVIKGKTRPRLQMNRPKGRLPLSGWCPTRGMFDNSSCRASAKLGDAKESATTETSYRTSTGVYLCSCTQGLKS